MAQTHKSHAITVTQLYFSVFRSPLPLYIYMIRGLPVILDLFIAEFTKENRRPTQAEKARVGIQSPLRDVDRTGSQAHRAQTKSSLWG